MSPVHTGLVSSTGVLARVSFVFSSVEISARASHTIDQQFIKHQETRSTNPSFVYIFSKGWLNRCWVLMSWVSNRSFTSQCLDEPACHSCTNVDNSWQEEDKETDVEPIINQPREDMKSCNTRVDPKVKDLLSMCDWLIIVSSFVSQACPAVKEREIVDVPNRL